MSATARTAVRAVALTSPSPQHVLPSVGRLLTHETDQLVTVFLALLDVKTGEALLQTETPSASWTPCTTPSPISPPTSRTT